jgi:hypothetical protein
MICSAPFLRVFNPLFARSRWAAHIVGIGVLICRIPSATAAGAGAARIIGAGIRDGIRLIRAAP